METPPSYDTGLRAFDVLPSLPREEPTTPTEEPPRKRHPVPIDSPSPRDRLHLQIFLQLAAHDLLRFPPSKQPGWIILFLELLDVEHFAIYKERGHLEYVLHALIKEITDRLETGRW